MGGNIVETVIGAVVIAFATIFLLFAYETADLGTNSGGIELIAKFDRIDGLQVGSDVRISGIKVGTVIDSVIDMESYLAVVKMSLREGILVPEDTAAKITAESLLGGNYLSLEPGGAEDMLENGDEITFTQGSVNLQDLIGQAIFSAADDDSKDKASD
jgi:phospholipid/cholesterol/gamma-HCH transport system substrate-binding protein